MVFLDGFVFNQKPKPANQGATVDLYLYYIEVLL